MSTFNFHGQISGPSNFGDNGKIEIHQGASPVEALRLAAELVQQLRQERRLELAEQAEIVRGELVQAGEERRPADQGRVRQALETISLGLAAGSGGIALVQEIGRLVGL
ncbi:MULTISPECIES: hypothetical protein [unclassified Streptomyces]|uniref:hypothetical protein n=1 Tax=unclassified Streptomyces TaxID=2593676 RepID=UPI00225995E7|nr:MULTISPECIES: hypothetical protein [unclassified Streptomyces]MCX4392949.1 hypothetical protein [Streptomyces sp. NBC_01767]WSC33158.1 hypothetical protein OG902_09740 [Streptomyces sp. NBC_01768]